MRLGGFMGNNLHHNLITYSCMWQMIEASTFSWKKRMIINRDLPWTKGCRWGNISYKAIESRHSRIMLFKCQRFDNRVSVHSRKCCLNVYSFSNCSQTNTKWTNLITTYSDGNIHAVFWSQRIVGHTFVDKNSFTFQSPTPHPRGTCV